MSDRTGTEAITTSAAQIEATATGSVSPAPLPSADNPVSAFIDRVIPTGLRLEQARARASAASAGNESVDFLGVASARLNALNQLFNDMAADGELSKAKLDELKRQDFLDYTADLSKQGGRLGASATDINRGLSQYREMSDSLFPADFVHETDVGGVTLTEVNGVTTLSTGDAATFVAQKLSAIEEAVGPTVAASLASDMQGIRIEEDTVYTTAERQRKAIEAVLQIVANDAELKTKTVHYQTQELALKVLQTGEEQQAITSRSRLPDLTANVYTNGRTIIQRLMVDPDAKDQSIDNKLAIWEAQMRNYVTTPEYLRIAQEAGTPDMFTNQVKDLKEFAKSMFTSVDKLTQLKISNEHKKVILDRWSLLFYEGLGPQMAVALRESRNASNLARSFVDASIAKTSALPADNAILAMKALRTGQSADNLDLKVDFLETATDGASLTLRMRDIVGAVNNGVKGLLEDDGRWTNSGLWSSIMKLMGDSRMTGFLMDTRVPYANRRAVQQLFTDVNDKLRKRSNLTKEEVETFDQHTYDIPPVWTSELPPDGEGGTDGG